MNLKYLICSKAKRYSDIDKIHENNYTYQQNYIHKKIERQHV